MSLLPEIVYLPFIKLAEFAFFFSNNFGTLNNFKINFYLFFCNIYQIKRSR